MSLSLFMPISLVFMNFLSRRGCASYWAYEKRHSLPWGISIWILWATGRLCEGRGHDKVSCDVQHTFSKLQKDRQHFVPQILTGTFQPRFAFILNTRQNSQVCTAAGCPGNNKRYLKLITSQVPHFVQISRLSSNWLCRGSNNLQQPQTESYWAPTNRVGFYRNLCSWIAYPWAVSNIHLNPLVFIWKNLYFFGQNMRFKIQNFGWLRRSKIIEQRRGSSSQESNSSAFWNLRCHFSIAVRLHFIKAIKRYMKWQSTWNSAQATTARSNWSLKYCICRCCKPL